MTDKYQDLRDGMPELQREAARKGGCNPRSQLIIDLLAERDTLQAENKRLRAAFENLANLRASHIKKEKDAFELWITSKHPGANLSPHQNNCGIMSSTDYMHQKVQAAWDAWLARAALAHGGEG